MRLRTSDAATVGILAVVVGALSLALLLAYAALIPLLAKGPGRLTAMAQAPPAGPSQRIRP